MTRHKNPAWVRGPLPDDIKITFVVNRNNDPFLHTYLAGVPFRGASAEIRRLLKIALRVEANGGEEAAAVASPSTQESKVVSAPASTRTAGPTKPVQDKHENFPSRISGSGASGSLVLNQETLNAIAMLDEMSG